jgi:hypothetical protein
MGVRLVHGQTQNGRRQRLKRWQVLEKDFQDTRTLTYTKNNPKYG